MTFHIISRPILALAATLAMAAPLHAQQDLRFGDFRVRVQRDLITDEEESIAVLFPRGDRGGSTGWVSWMCVGPDADLMVGLRLGGTARSREMRDVVWRFDSERPDSAQVTALSGSETWFLRLEDAPSFTRRARSASRLVIRVIGGEDFVYDLAGSTSALNRLSCARNPRMPVRPAPQPEEETPPKRPSREDAEGTYELSAVTERPQPTNVAVLMRELERNYPPLLRDAGVTGMVRVRFRVLADGSVDSASIAVTESSLDAFDEPTRRAVQVLRFRPARVNGRPVRVWVELPIQWTVMIPEPADSTAAPPP